MSRRKPFTVKSRLVDYKRFCSFVRINHSFLRASSGSKQPQRKLFKWRSWGFSAKTKFILILEIIAIILISNFAFIPKGEQSTSNTPRSSDTSLSPSGTTQGTDNQTGIADSISDAARGLGYLFKNWQESTLSKTPGVIESAHNINNTVWRAVAANAWHYFQPGTGVDPNTGLPCSILVYSYFTDWDLGVYIQAVIDASNLGLIGNDGPWGSSARLEKVVSFLETREIDTATGIPFWFYNARTGRGGNTQSFINTVDDGRLFVALNNLKIFNSSLAPRINSIVLGNRTNYYSLVDYIKSSSTSAISIYDYYYTSGYASFFSELSDVPDAILNNMLNAGNVTTYGGVELPKASISCEPLLCSLFELNSKNPKLIALAKQVYLAHEANYNATGKYVAFSEGNSKSEFIWEWVILPNGDTWKITDSSNKYVEIEPVIYYKVAISFLFLYNTTFARNMVAYLEQCFPNTASGYSEGTDNSNSLVTFPGCNTNGLILSAARYAIQNDLQ